MSDNRQQGGDQQLKEASESKERVSEGVRNETADGMESQSKSVKDYYQARRDGMRDPHTQEILPPQPSFFDSSKELAAEHTIDNSSAVTDNASKTGQIERDSEGRPTKITYSDGNSNEIKYGPDGNPSELHTRDGSTWKKEDGEWTRYKDGKKIDDEVGNFQVTKEGDIVATRKDGTPDMIKHSDGSITEFGKDGKSQITRDINERPTSITYSDGSTNKITYDQDGNPTEMHTRDGSTWKKEDGEWNRYKNGKKIDDPIGDFQVTKEGDIIATRKDGTPDMIKHADGSVTEYGKDGNSQITRDINERPTSITYPDGNTNKITYDKEGNPIEMNTRDGSTWKKENGEWNRYKDGKKIDDEVGDFKVTKDGDILATRKDGTPDMVKHSDGSLTEFGKDGKSQMTTDSDGKPTSITYPDGNTNKIVYDADGNPTELKLADNSSWKKEDGHWNRYDDQGNKVEESEGDFKVGKNGDLISLKKDGSVDEVLHKDGTQS